MEIICVKQNTGCLSWRYTSLLIIHFDYMRMFLMQINLFILFYQNLFTHFINSITNIFLPKSFWFVCPTYDFLISTEKVQRSYIRRSWRSLNITIFRDILSWSCSNSIAILDVRLKPSSCWNHMLIKLKACRSGVKKYFIVFTVSYPVTVSVTPFTIVKEVQATDLAR